MDEETILWRFNLLFSMKEPAWKLAIDLYNRDQLSEEQRFAIEAFEAFVSD